MARRQRASCSAKPPPSPAWRAPEGPQGLAAARTDRGADGRSGRHRHHRQPNFARNLSRSFFEMPQTRCNSNDANSMFESVVEELRAELLVDSHSWASGQCTDQHQPRRPHRCGGCWRGRRAWLRGTWAAQGAARPHSRAWRPDNPWVHKQQPEPHSNT